jgi:hypothetical protein
MNQPFSDTAAYFPETDDFFVPRVIQTPEEQFLSNNEGSRAYNISPEANTEGAGGEEMEALLGGDNGSAGTPLYEDEVDTYIIPTATETFSFRPSGVVNPGIASALNDSSAPSSPRHRRVSFDLDTEDKEEKSSSRSRKEEAAGKNMVPADPTIMALIFFCGFK